MLNEPTLESIHQIVPDLMETAVIPGVSLAVVHDDTIWQSQWGVMNTNSKESVTIQTAFQAASLSKAVFAYAVLQLVSNGQFNLDIPLITYLPDSEQSENPLFDHMVNEPNLHQITARHVLSHTPGFPNWAAQDTKLQTAFIPGTRFSYSGEGYMYLQRVVARFLQQDIHEWIRQTTLKPLQMTNATFTVTRKNASRVAIGHDKTGKPADFWEIPEMGAAYSLHCTAVAYAQFLRTMLQPSPLTNLMLTPQIQVNDSAANDDDWPALDALPDPLVSWGLGWGLQEGENGRTFWHWGDNGTFKAFAAGQPASGTAVVIFANSQNGATLWRPILETTFASHDWPALDWLNRTFGSSL